MTETRQCSHCGSELPADAPLGLCPRCVLNVGVSSQTPTVGSRDGQPALSPASAFVPPAPADLAPLFPQLEILELLGQGGMGAVYKARQPGLDRLVALKILPPGMGADPAFAERFTREARSLARLSHPNVVAVYDFGQAGDLYYFIMEYVDGVNLREMQRAQRLDPRQALGIVVQVCEALQYAHDEGIVHRDIKPENLLIDKKGRVKIADFGLAKLLGRTQTVFTLTSAGQMLGTPAYMAPEQVERPGIVDQRADIYSLGVVFYEMLTGELPLGRFQAPSQMVHVDVRLDEVVLKALEKQPERRYQHASEVKTDVETIATGRGAIGGGVAHVGESRLEAWWFSQSELTRRYIKAVLILVTVAGMVGLLYYHGDQENLGEGKVHTLTRIGFWDPWYVDEWTSGIGGRHKASLYTGSCLLGLVAGLSACAGIMILRSEKRRRRARQALGRRDQQASEETVRHRLRMPAIGLIVAGALTCLGGPLFLGWAILQLMVKRVADEPGSVFPGFSETAILCCVAFSGILVVLGAVKMLRLKSYGLAVAGSILAMLPCTLGFPVGLVMGIWALVVLRRPEVQRTFAAAPAKSKPAPGISAPPPPPQAAAQHPGKGRQTRTAWIVAGVIVGALLLLAVPIVGGLVIWLLVQRQVVKPANELDLGGGVTMKMVLIPAGKFMMGSPDSEPGRVVHEGPQHEVTISRPFYMGVTEVTQAQYQAIMGANPSGFAGETNPVEHVSWTDATEFCKKLSERTRRTVRLPTEAEWEYACRAGSKTKFCFGDADEVLGDYGWSEANSGSTTHPVGQKEPNAWGLYDMHGNLCEWCADWYGEYPKGAVTDPQGPASGTYRVLRGGCWLTAPSVDRSALRVLDPPSKRTAIYGFRVVVSVPGLPAAEAQKEARAFADAFLGVAGKNPGPYQDGPAVVYLSPRYKKQLANKGSWVTFRFDEWSIKSVVMSPQQDEAYIKGTFYALRARGTGTKANDFSLTLKREGSDGNWRVEAFAYDETVYVDIPQK